MNIYKTINDLPDKQPEGTLLKMPPCIVCHKSILAIVSDDEYMRLHDGGANIQSLFPELNADEREMIKTGIHSPECWDAMFGDDDEDDR